MRYVTIEDLSNMIRKNLWKIPHDLDLVVGIPRSGMLAANMIALFLNTNLADIDSFINGKIYSNGLTRNSYIRKSDSIRKVLVVDDSIRTGASLNNAKKKLEAIQDQNIFFLFCAPIATSIGSSMVDFCFEIIDDERVFEWNIFHHSVLSRACVDIDGVLCVDPSEDDDGEKYQLFIQNAPPLFTPTCKINTLISCRLEKYRFFTENWLAQNKVSYDQLIMLDFPNKAARVAWGKHGNYKGEYYKQRADCMLFIESSEHQAKIIAEISKKPVYCVETNTMLIISQSPFVSKKRSILRVLKKRFPKSYCRCREFFCVVFKKNK